MNVSGRIVLFTLAGVVAALLTVCLTDVVRLIPIPEKTLGLTAAEARQHVLGAVAFGTLLGVALAVADNLAQGRRDWLRVVGLGLAIGAATAFVGVNFGMSVLAQLYGDAARSTPRFLGNVLARGLAWMTIGGFVGAVDGIRKASPTVARNGVIGGLIGGFLGGVLFEIVPYLLPGLRSGAPSRLVGFGATGALVGLFIALVQQLLREAWVRVVVGRNEGKEFLVEKAQTVLGRGELCDIPLFGDPSVAKRHAVLALQSGGGWAIADTGEAPAGVLVNGARIAAPQPLRSGDQIQLGGKNLVFYEKQVRARTAPVRREGPAAPVAPPTQSWATAPVSAPRAGRLVVTSGPHAGAAFPLQAGAVLGRDAANAVALPADTKASRRHAQLVADDAGWAVEDLGSTNGTFVNGQRITRQGLAPGDTILIGQTALRLDA